LFERAGGEEAKVRAFEGGDGFGRPLGRREQLDASRRQLFLKGRQSTGITVS
jgi:hypothetical protein